MIARTVLTLLLASASAAFAQGRGARQGGPGPLGQECLDRDNIDHIRMLKGAGAIAEYGPDATHGIVIISPKADGVNVFGPCPTAGSMDDPFNANLFAPSWVLIHQQDIALSDEQKNFIQQRMAVAKTQFTMTEMKLRGEMASLNNLLAAKPVDESKALDAMDRVLMLEREIKRAQISLMVSVKNKLTEQQTAQLEKLRGGDNQNF